MRKLGTNQITSHTGDAKIKQDSQAVQAMRKLRRLQSIRHRRNAGANSHVSSYVLHELIGTRIHVFFVAGTHRSIVAPTCAVQPTRVEMLRVHNPSRQRQHGWNVQPGNTLQAEPHAELVLQSSHETCGNRMDQLIWYMCATRDCSTASGARAPGGRARAVRRATASHFEKTESI